MKKIWIIPMILLIMVPLGLIAEGSAWGEWPLQELSKMVGFVPQGMRNLSELWSSVPFRDYTLPFMKGFLGYIIAGIIGAGIAALIVGLAGFRRTERK